MREKQECDLGWGNPYFLLEILDEMYVNKMQFQDIYNMSYAPDNGFPELIELTKRTIEQTTGLKYKHVFITAGATQAINTIFHFEKKSGSKFVKMREFGYPYYTSMVINAGLERIPLGGDDTKAFILLDSPSNPLGEQLSIDHAGVYWDAVYHNKIYNANMNIVPQHRAMIGSYSKLLGLTGVRIGWVATNSDSYYQLLSSTSLADTATVSIPSQKLVTDILKTVNLGNFLQKGKNHLDDNREELQKLSHLFCGLDVPECGMFYCIPANKQIFDLFRSCRVRYVKIREDLLRLSLGQTRSITKAAVKAILKEDRR